MVTRTPAFVSIRSPWRSELVRLVRSAERSIAVLAPYMTRGGMETVVEEIRHPDEVSVFLGTTFSLESVISGSMDIRAVSWAYENLPCLRVTHIPRLHAKVYVADVAAAIVTSGNLTTASLLHNNEYGIGIRDPETVQAIRSDVADYAALGSPASRAFVLRLHRLASRFVSEAGGGDAERQAEKAKSAFDLELRRLRGDAGEARTAIFARTVIHVLRGGPMKTVDIHQMVRDIQPDLCDDDEERVINGVRFGKRWKHDVRNAQQRLKQQGQIALVDGQWRLVSS